MRYEVYMEQTVSTVVYVDAESEDQALLLANMEGVDTHEGGDVAQEWTAISAEVAR